MFDTDPTALAAELLKAINSGQWALAAVLAVIGATIVAKRYGAKWWPWLGTVPGAVVIALLGSVGGALATAQMAGQPLTWGLALKAVMVAVVALAPSAAVRSAESKGQKAAGNVVDISDALKELNK